MSAESVSTQSRWLTRAIPVFLAGATGIATYTTVARICVDYLISQRGEYAAAIVILVLFFILLLSMVGTYLRTLSIILRDPGLLPLGPLAVERRLNEQSRRRKSRKNGDLEAQAYDAGPDLNPDSPGLEQFYSKNVFVSESDGRPRWCSECCNWKPDRAHHSSEINRCVLRMDHYCPWTGGMIGENSFKFFVQFTAYTAAFCALVLGVSAYALRKEIEDGWDLDGFVLATLIISAFFGLFTFLMTMTSLRYIMINMTNIDMLGAGSKVYQLAVRVPLETQATDKFSTVIYPLPRPGEKANEPSEGASDPSTESNPNPQAARDALAIKKFAILRTETGDNPWDLGFRRNWKAVMGNNFVDWFLPLHRSPLTTHDNAESFYPMGPMLREICARYGLENVVLDDQRGVEMRQLSRDDR